MFRVLHSLLDQDMVKDLEHIFIGLNAASIMAETSRYGAYSAGQSKHAFWGHMSANRLCAMQLLSWVASRSSTWSLRQTG